MVLPRPESFEVGSLISILALEWPTSKLSGRDETILTYIIGTQKLVCSQGLGQLNGGV